MCNLWSTIVEMWISRHFMQNAPSPEVAPLACPEQVLARPFSRIRQIASDCSNQHARSEKNATVEVSYESRGKLFN